MEALCPGTRAPVRIFAKELPDGRAIGVDKRHLTLGMSSIEEKREDGIFANIFSNIFLRIIRPHLFLIDVFFENISKDVGIDFVALT